MEHLLAGVAPLRLLSWDDAILLLLPLATIVSANLRLAPPAGDRPLPVFARFLGSTIWLQLATVAAIVTLQGLFTLAGQTAVGQAAAGKQTAGGTAAGAVLLIAGVASALLLTRPAREMVARLLPIDPDSPVDATALVLSLLLVAAQAASQLATDVLAREAAGTALRPVDLLAQELPFLLAALFGVGFLLRRPAPAALRRLGLVRPTPWQLIIALAAAGLFYAFGNASADLAHHYTRSLADRVDAANNRLFGQLTDPAGIATLALAAGVCEEALFRGAMQPRLGLVWTAVVFTATHSQYGLSLDAVAVLVLAVGLGLLRRATNTTTTVVCHVAYNGLVSVSVGGAWLAPALIVEAALLVGGLAGLFTGRLGRLRTAP